MSLLSLYSDELEEEKEEKVAGSSDKDDEALITSASASKLIWVLISCVCSDCGDTINGDSEGALKFINN